MTGLTNEQIAQRLETSTEGNNQGARPDMVKALQQEFEGATAEQVKVYLNKMKARSDDRGKLIGKSKNGLNIFERIEKATDGDTLTVRTAQARKAHLDKMAKIRRLTK